MPALAADRVSRIVLGLHAAALASVHGAFALQQGAVALAGPLFSAIGPPCEPVLAWHACLPALTLAPDLRTAALLTLSVAALTAVAALVFTGRRAALALGVAALAATLAAAVASPLGVGSLPSVAGMAAVVFGYSPLLWMGLWFADGTFAKPAAPTLTIARDPRWWAAAVAVLATFAGVLGRTLTFA